MDGLLKDLRYAVRGLRKSPVLTAGVVLSLALGIGANTTIFTGINAIFLRPLPVEKPRELVAVFTKDAHVKNLLRTSYPNYLDYRNGNKTFAALAADWKIPLTLTLGGKKAFIVGQLASGNYFDVLGVKAALGRTFRPEEDKVPSQAPVVVLSHKFWQNRFGGDPKIVGKTITLDEKPFKVVGVAPAGFIGTHQMNPPALWVPTMMHEWVLSGTKAGGLDSFFNRHETIFNIVGRLKPGVDIPTAEADLGRISREIEKAWPRQNIDRTAHLIPLAQATIEPGQRHNMLIAGTLLMGVVSLVLIIACANVANLLLSRAVVRRKEIAIRLAMGAGRPRLIRQLLLESTLLSLLGGGVGLLVALWGRNRLWAASAPFLPFSLDLKLSTNVLLFTLALSLLSGLLFGLVPALQTSRPDLVPALKEQEPGKVRMGRRLTMGSTLVILQVALSLVAVILSVLFLRSLDSLQKTDSGLDGQHLALISFADVTSVGYNDDTGKEFYRQVVARAEAVPGVRSATVTEYMPLVDGGAPRTIYLNGQDQYHGGYGLPVLSSTVGLRYFETMGIPVVRGRDFKADDTITFGEQMVETLKGTPRIIINEALANQYLPGKDPVGMKVMMYGVPFEFTITGIVRDSKYKSLGEEPQPYVYFFVPQYFCPIMTLFVNTADPAAVLPKVRDAVKAVDPRIPLINVATMSEVFEQTLLAPRLGAVLLTLFAVLALLLSAIGTYGVIAYLFGQRLHEIGVRMALGARRGELLGLLLRQGMSIVGLGVLLGLAVAFLATLGVKGFLTGVSAWDPLSFWGAALLLILVAFVAVLFSTRRAIRVNPAVALSSE
jgi:predicted permease